jgi:hypothetical protein
MSKSAQIRKAKEALSEVDIFGKFGTSLESALAECDKVGITEIDRDVEAVRNVWIDLENAKATPNKKRKRAALDTIFQILKETVSKLAYNLATEQ